MMLPTVWKDTFLFSILTAITSMVVFSSYLSLHANSLLWLSAILLLLAFLLLYVNHRPAIAIHSRLGIGVFLFLFLSIMVVYSPFVLKFVDTQDIKGEVTNTGNLIWKISIVLTNLILVVLFLPRSKNIYPYLFLIASYSVCMGLLFFADINLKRPFHILVVTLTGGYVGMTMVKQTMFKPFEPKKETLFQILESVLSGELWTIACKIGFIAGFWFVLNDDIQKNHLALSSITLSSIVFAILKSLLLGLLWGILFACVGLLLGVVLLSLFLKIFQLRNLQLSFELEHFVYNATGLRIWLGTLIGTAVGVLLDALYNSQLGVIAITGMVLTLLLGLTISYRGQDGTILWSSYGRKLYYGIFFVLLVILSGYYLYYLHFITSLVLGFIASFLFNILSAIAGLFFTLSISRKKELLQRSGSNFLSVAMGKVFYNFLIGAFIVSLSFLINNVYIHAKDINVSFFSCIVTFPILAITDQIFEFFSKASQMERAEMATSVTMLCMQHYLRPVPGKKNALIYRRYECSIADCRHENTISGVERLVGIISNFDFPLNTNNIVYLLLWDQTTKQARYADIDCLEIYYEETFTEEDYNHAIQSVVGKLCNHMVVEKLNKVQVTVDPRVQLSEASKRLLQDTFGEY
ncbi:MAG: hypothetical protein AAF518_14065 [Spirochaetota bacterium]